MKHYFILISIVLVVVPFIAVAKDLHPNYSIENGKVYFKGKEVIGADAETFESIYGCLGKDAKTQYVKTKKLDSEVNQNAFKGSWLFIKATPYEWDISFLKAIDPSYFSITINEALEVNNIGHTTDKLTIDENGSVYYPIDWKERKWEPTNYHFFVDGDKLTMVSGGNIYTAPCREVHYVRESFLIKIQIFFNRIVKYILYAISS